MRESWILLVFVVLVYTETAEAQSGTTLAGYTFETDVSEHAKIDLDIEEMEAAADNFDFTEAEDLYANGKHSQKSDELRTVKGFSTSAGELLDGNAFFDIYREYWGRADYADDFVTSALQGTGSFEGTADITRAECAVKGAQYQAVWMYVYRELVDAFDDCEAGDQMDNDDKGVKAWDEGWAFYAGSIEGSQGSGSGKLLYSLAEKRCLDFGTCSGEKAAVNNKILDDFERGAAVLRDATNATGCGGVVDITESIRTQMTVPLIQGALRYAYLADPAGGDEGEKAWAEGWAFSAAVLPQIDNCDEGAAKLIRENFEVTADGPVKDGFQKVADAFFGELSCLGLSCSDIGNFMVDGDIKIQCSTGTSGDNDDGVCFPADSEVMLAGGDAIRLDHLKVGDRIRVSDGSYSPVIFFGHKIDQGLFKFHSFGVECHGQTTVVEMTGNHYVLANGKLLQARQVQIGDQMTGIGSACVVQSIDVVMKHGLYSPVTAQGTIVVNSVVASCFTSALLPTFAHIILAPVRLIYAAVGWNAIGSLLNEHSGLNLARALGLPVGPTSL